MQDGMEKIILCSVGSFVLILTPHKTEERLCTKQPHDALELAS